MTYAFMEVAGKAAMVERAPEPSHLVMLVRRSESKRAVSATFDCDDLDHFIELLKFYSYGEPLEVSAIPRELVDMKPKDWLQKTVDAAKDYPWVSVPVETHAFTASS